MDFGEDSDESDGENGMGNVNRLIVRPPGHSGKAKRGHLCFDASFETGNLGRVDLINEFEYDLYIRPDSCSPRFRFWFNFTVDNVKQDQRVIFNIVNMHIGKNLFTARMTPMVKSSTRNKWQRMPKEYVFYHRSSTHRNHYVLSFVFGFDKEDEIYQFAMAIPYSYSRLQTFLNVLETRTLHLKRNFNRESLTTSLHNRRLELITVGNDKGAHNQSKKRIIAVMARINPGDSPSSMVCQGLLEILISSNSLASVLRKNVIFKVLPMMNPDGVFVGNHRSNIMGVDLSRSWHIATSFSHPTLWAVLQMLRSFQDESNQLDFVIDIHTHSSLNGCFIYGNTYDDFYRYERHVLFPKLFASAAVDYAKDNTLFNSDPMANGTSRRHLCCSLDSKVNTYLLEVSIFGYKTKEYDYLIPYSEESYKRCGMNLVKAFLEYYHCIGIIPTQLIKNLPTKKKRTGKRYKNNDKLTLGNVKRRSAQVHVQDISITYDSEITLETCANKKIRSPKVLVNTRNNRIKGEYTPRKFNKTLPETNEHCNVSLTETSLSIIDINKMLDF
ncbi:cytosolic carboxypeptidase 6-like isoform X2 [Coccinella septempunctata]|uniref:cytosolic carboxypeptidase 6-like isoform X2 n=1 Tax=Coccinella septempunctata TaxID=41139 RepID=UPI001D073E59|nr:cytosolic carboxypeptidase 6-like isoform X2 [Coccinella septempunctata]